MNKTMDTNGGKGELLRSVNVAVGCVKVYRRPGYGGPYIVACLRVHERDFEVGMLELMTEDLDYVVGCLLLSLGRALTVEVK